MATVTESIKTFKGIVSNPFGEDGCAFSGHLQTDENMTMIYPANSRVTASTKFSGFPSEALRSLNISTAGNYEGETAVLHEDGVFFLNPVTLATSDFNSAITPDNTMFFEFDGGLIYGRNNVSAPNIEKLVLDTTLEQFITIPTHISYFGTTLSYINRAVIAGNTSDGCNIYYLNTVNSGEVLPYTARFAIQLPNQCVSITEYQNYAAIALKANDGAIVAFWDGKSDKSQYIERVPNGDPLFIRAVAGRLILCSVSYNVNDIMLAFYEYNGSQFELVYSYKKYNPVDKTVEIIDASALADDGDLYFSGEFCGEKGLWKLNLSDYKLYLQSYSNNANTGNFTNINTCVLPTWWGIVANNTDAYCYQNTNNDYNNVSPVYITKRFVGGEQQRMKKWLSFGISAHTDFDEDGSTPSDKTILVEYRTDNNVSWNTIGTYTSTTSPFKEFTFENTEVTITDYYSIQFRLTWSGLTYVDSIYIKHDILPQIEI